MRGNFIDKARALGSGLGRLIVAAVALALVAAAKPPAQTASGGIDTKSDIALLIDAATGTVLFSKNADKIFVPGSLTKMMTVAVAAQEVKDGRLSMDGEFTVSEHAWRTGGAPSHTTTMFAPVNQPAKVSDLFRGVMIQSANDGAIALAEGIAGSESGFAELMNKRAAEWGMTSTRFGNPSGQANADNRTTARDLLVAARRLVKDYPDVYRIYSEREFTYNKIRQLNRHPMVDPSIGGDGIVTAASKEGGAALIGSAVQNGQRLLVAIAGAANDKDRNEDARKLVEWGFRSFETVRLYDAGETIGPAMVFGGASQTVALISPTDVDLLVPRGSRDKLKARVVYTGPVKAPIVKGRPIGRLWVTNDEKPVVDYPVEAGADVPVGSIGHRAVDGTRELLIGLLRR